MQIQSKACCTNPPVVLAGGYDYELKGKYEEYYGLKTCKTPLITQTLSVHGLQRPTDPLIAVVSYAVLIGGFTYMHYR